jgi:hypothetical protein
VPFPLCPASLARPIGDIVTTTIYAPSGVNGETYIGPVTLQFVEGVAKYDGDLPEGALIYMRSHGYGIDAKAPEVADQTPDVPDPRDLVTTLVGTDLRDAAVDPRPEDFLPPVNAGEENPHGPKVVAPGIHAASTAKPIHPGPVGASGDLSTPDSDKSPNVIKDTDVQAANESALAEAVLVDQTPVPEATAAAAKVDPVNEDAKRSDDSTDADAFDPSAHTVDDVLAYLDSADDAERGRVIAAERDGKARKTLLGD